MKINKAVGAATYSDTSECIAAAFGIYGLDSMCTDVLKQNRTKHTQTHKP